MVSGVARRRGHRFAHRHVSPALAQVTIRSRDGRGSRVGSSGRAELAPAGLTESAVDLLSSWRIGSGFVPVRSTGGVFTGSATPRRTSALAVRDEVAETSSGRATTQSRCGAPSSAIHGFVLTIFELWDVCYSYNLVQAPKTELKFC